MTLAGAVAIVTGGAHRLGRAIVLELARAGCHVVINYHHSADAGRETLAAVRGLGGLVGCAEIFQADVADPDQARALVEYAIGRFGALDIFVANAGVFRRTPIDRVTGADWDEMIRGNVETFLHGAQQAGSVMRERGGAIVAIADVAGINPWADYLPYSVAKSCVLALMRSLAADLAPSVRVNAIAPGPILFPPDYPADLRQREINRTLLRRQGCAADIAEAVRFLAAADYITGVVLPVDGGRVLFRRDA